MARVEIPVVKLEEKNKLSASISTLTAAVNASDGAEFVMNGRDDKYLILVHNAATSAKTVTVKAGNGLQGVRDLTESVAASSYAILAIESGRFKNVSGEDRGKVIIKGEDANIKLAVFMLP